MEYFIFLVQTVLMLWHPLIHRGEDGEVKRYILNILRNLVWCVN